MTFWKRRVREEEAECQRCCKKHRNSQGLGEWTGKCPKERRGWRWDQECKLRLEKQGSGSFFIHSSAACFLVLWCCSFMLFKLYMLFTSLHMSTHLHAKWKVRAGFSFLQMNQNVSDMRNFSVTALIMLGYQVTIPTRHPNFFPQLWLDVCIFNIDITLSSLNLNADIFLVYPQVIRNTYPLSHLSHLSFLP